MATVGHGDKAPETVRGKAVASVDALAGLILIGVVVWFFTQTLQMPARPTEGDGSQRTRSSRAGRCTRRTAQRRSSLRRQD